MAQHIICDWFINDFGNTVVNFCLDPKPSMKEAIAYLFDPTQASPALKEKPDCWQIELPNKKGKEAR